MKKLIPLFLTGIFTLSGVNVFANSSIEAVTATDTQVTLRSHPLELNESVLNVQVGENTYKFVSVADIFQSFGISFYWNNETSTLAITENILSIYQEMRELYPIVERIDIDNINPEEWISDHILFTLGPDTNWGSNGFMLEAQEVIITNREELSLRDWHDYDPEINIIFTSITGCNAEKIRSIVVTEELEYWSAQRFKLNIQDLLDSGLVSAEQIEEELRREQIFGGFDTFTEEELAQMELETLLRSVEHGIFSAEQMEQLLELAKIQISDI